MENTGFTEILSRRKSRNMTVLGNGADEWMRCFNMVHPG